MALFLNLHTHRQVPGERAIRNVLSDFHALDKEGVFSCGMHPWYITKETAEEQFAALYQAVQIPSVLAIGECGLDKVCATDFELQLTYFRKQIELANSVGKPVIIHCVKAWEEVINEKEKEPFGLAQGPRAKKKEKESEREKEEKNEKEHFGGHRIRWLSGHETNFPSPETPSPSTLPCFIIHGFSKSPELAARLIEAGFYLSFGKHLLNPNSACASAFKQTPLDRVFFETDDADIPIEEIYRAAALVKELDIDVLCSQVEANVLRVFGRTF